jgi:hypothetical protein
MYLETSVTRRRIKMEMEMATDLRILLGSGSQAKLTILVSLPRSPVTVRGVTLGVRG